MDPPASPQAELYEIPATFEAYILFYNKDLVDQDLDGVVPRTMPELIAAVQRINRAGNGEVVGAVMRGIRQTPSLTLLRDNWGDMASAIADAIQPIYAGASPETVTQALRKRIIVLAQSE